MQFNSFTFLIFFGIVLFLYHLPFSWRSRKLILLLASYLFYAAWNPPFVILIWISTMVDWEVAKRLGRATRPGARRTLVLLSLGVNFGLLGFYKYGGFLLENFTMMMRALGVEFQAARPDIVLPVGISFYTFQTLSYTLDVYKGKAKPWSSPLDFALFVTFFPQLVAGPIVRAVDFLPQCREPRRATPNQFSWGLSLLVLGIFEKVVVADGLLAPIADKLYTGPGIAGVGFRDAWAGTFAFSGQIFCDFAGYSTCAIGAALCLGFAIQDNFRFPYAARGFSDFWKRWHISLSSWLRDYLYISLGGNRKGNVRTYVNLMLTMLLGGLWHGASWTFVFWGGLHGLYLIVERALKKALGHLRAWSLWPVGIGLMLATYGLVCFTWVFFRARTFGDAFSISAAMCGLSPETTGGLLSRRDQAIALGMTVVIVAIHWTLRNSSVEAVAGRIPWWLRSVILSLLLLAIITMSGEDRAFIYFQF